MNSQQAASSTPTQPAVSITLVLYKSAPVLDRCLDSLAPAIADGLAELIAVDNASPDDSADTVRQRVPSARVISQSENRGFAAGCNAAWPHVRGRYWLLLNPDVVVPDGGLATLTRWLDEHPLLGIASPELDDGAGSQVSAGRSFPSATRALLELTRLHRLLPPAVRERVLRGPYWRGGDQTNADWVPGAAMLARREAVQQAGLLDERFFMYGEDLEWCWRVRRHGWGIGVCAATAFRHQAGSSAQEEWTELERSRRMADGVNRAIRTARGPGRARATAVATAAALRLESVDPRRSAAQRRQSLVGYYAWLPLALGGRGRPS